MVIKRRFVNIILAVTLVITAVGTKTNNVQAAYSEEKKYSYDKLISITKKAPMLWTLKPFRDNHGYYAVYSYNGRVECFLGKKNEKMYFSDFAKKLGGTSKRNVKTFTVTKTENELKKLALSALVAYICFQAGCSEVTSFVIGYVNDKAVETVLRKPGKYRMTNVMTSVRAFDKASLSYMETYYFINCSKLEKYNSKKKSWKVVYKTTQPQFLY